MEIQRYDRAELEKTVRLLDWSRSFCYEVRVLGKRHGVGAPDFRTGIGRFDETGIPKMLEAVAHYSGYAEGIYLIMNPLPRRSLFRYHNRIDPFAASGATDDEIAAFHWTLIDLDVVKPKGVSSTDEEHEEALARGREVAKVLIHFYDSRVVMCDSGNGCHLLVNRKAERDEGEAHALWIIQRLTEKFSDEKVRVDPMTHNAARLTKFYGTLVCKGDPDPEENPHRLSRVLEVWE